MTAPRLVIVVKGGLVETVYITKRLKLLDVIVLDKDRKDDNLPDPDLAEDEYTLKLVELDTREAEQPIYTNYYGHCGVKWTDEWSCACDDECPKCGHDISPYKSIVREASTE